MHTEEKSSFLWESVHMFLHRKKKDRWEEGVRVALQLQLQLHERVCAYKCSVAATPGFCLVCCWIGELYDSLVRPGYPVVGRAHLRQQAPTHQNHYAAL